MGLHLMYSKKTLIYDQNNSEQELLIHTVLCYGRTHNLHRSAQ